MLESHGIVKDSWQCSPTLTCLGSRSEHIVRTEYLQDKSTGPVLEDTCLFCYPTYIKALMLDMLTSFMCFS